MRFGYIFWLSDDNGPEAAKEELLFVKPINPPKPRMKTLVFSSIRTIVDVSSTSYLHRVPVLHPVIITKSRAFSTYHSLMGRLLLGVGPGQTNKIGRARVCVILLNYQEQAHIIKTRPIDASKRSASIQHHQPNQTLLKSSPCPLLTKVNLR